MAWGKECGSAQRPGEEPGGRRRLPHPRVCDSGVMSGTGIPERAEAGGGTRPCPHMPSTIQSPGQLVALAPVLATLSAACTHLGLPPTPVQCSSPAPQVSLLVPQTPVASRASAPLPATLLLAMPGYLCLILGPSAWVLPPPGTLLVCRDLRGGRLGEEMAHESCPQPTWVQIPAPPRPGCATPGRGCLLRASVSLLETGAGPRELPTCAA